MVDILSRANIVPIIFPYRSMDGLGKMHNKFVVIDNDHVFTGSANYTQSAFNTAQSIFNWENVVIIHDHIIAKKYQGVFDNLESDILGLYIDLVAKNNIPKWLKILKSKLPREKLLQIFKRRQNEYNKTEHNRVQIFFEF